MSAHKIIRRATRLAAESVLVVDSFEAAVELAESLCSRFGAETEVRTLNGARRLRFKNFRYFADDPGTVTCYTIDLPRVTPLRPQTRAEYDEARRIRYRLRAESRMLCNPASMHYSWQEAQREQVRAREDEARFAAEWRFHDRYTFAVNQRWESLRIRLAQHQKAREARARTERQRAAVADPIARRDVAGVMDALRTTWGAAA